MAVTRITVVDAVPFDGSPVPGKGMAGNSAVMGTAVGIGPLDDSRKDGDENSGSGRVTLMAVVTDPIGRIVKSLTGDGVGVTSGDASDDASTPVLREGLVVETITSLDADVTGTEETTDVSLGVDVAEAEDSAGGSSSFLFQPKMRAKKSLITSSPVRDLNASSTFWKTLSGSSPTLARRAAETSAGICSP